MLILMTGNEISENWPAIQESLELCTPEREKVEGWIPNLWFQLLCGQMNCWQMVGTAEEQEYIIGYLFTMAVGNAVTQRDSLLIYGVRTYIPATPEMTFEVLEKLTEYAKAKNFQMISTYTDNVDLLKLGRMAGFEFEVHCYRML